MNRESKSMKFGSGARCIRYLDRILGKFTTQPFGEFSYASSGHVQVVVEILSSWQPIAGIDHANATFAGETN